MVSRHAFFVISELVCRFAAAGAPIQRQGEARFRWEALWLRRKLGYAEAARIQTMPKSDSPATLLDVAHRRETEEERREAAAALARQTRIFDMVLSSIADFAYIFDQEGRFVFANRSLADLLQMTPEAMVGKNFFELGYPAELAEKLQGEIQHVFATQEIVRNETPFTSPAGTTGFYEYIFQPLIGPDGVVENVVGSTRDVTSRKQSEGALSESEERYRLLVEGARDYAIFLLDPSNTIMHWNSGAERIFGWTAEEAIGQSGELVFTPEDRAREQEEKEIEIALREGSAADVRWHLRKDGTRVWVDGVMRRLESEKTGALRGFAKIARDATDQRKAELALREARDELEVRVEERTRELVAMNRELERTMSQRQQLEKELLEISEREKRRIGEDLHDMVCQELTATALFLKSGAKRVLEESPSAATTLEEAAQIVNRNVGLTRDLARGLQPADLKGTGLKEALRVLALQACESEDVQCHFKAARGVRVTDDTVALHLYRVAQEALKNALKHSGAKNILIHLDKSEENICVSVQDDGKGFSPRRRSKGLGMHIMRYRANALGGHLKIEKRRTGGMDVTCVVPQKR